MLRFSPAYSSPDTSDVAILRRVNNGPTLRSRSCTIRDVWASNLEEEFRTIAHLVQTHHYVAMDTEFPGVVVRPDDIELQPPAYQYAMVRDNVNILRIIQLGLAFRDENGNLAPNCSSWQFNFKFSLETDDYAEDSIGLLIESGIQFKKHEEEGIDPNEFAQLCTVSGVVLSDSVRWLVFHGGFDFGYLLRLLTGQKLPEKESEFYELLSIYFPAIYDVKYIMQSCPMLKGGLQQVAKALQVERVGRQHQAGSDSLLTGAVFFKIRQVYFGGYIDDDYYCGHVAGLRGVAFVLYGNTHDNTVPASTFNSTVDPNHAKPDRRDPSS